MTQTEFARLIEPDLDLAVVVERVLKEFIELHPADHLELIPRYQDGPVWLIRQQIPEETRTIFFGAQVAFFETLLREPSEESSIRREVDIIPFVWLDLGKDGIRVQPSIPKKVIRRLWMPTSPYQEYTKWSSYLKEELIEAWRTTEMWAKEPTLYATEHVPPHSKSNQ